LLVKITFNFNLQVIKLLKMLVFELFLNSLNNYIFL